MANRSWMSGGSWIAGVIEDGRMDGKLGGLIVATA